MSNFLSDIQKTKDFLGTESLNCLSDLFHAVNGTPPYVNKARYRANNASQMAILDELENTHSLIKTEYINYVGFYCVKPCALPLIDSDKSNYLLKIMDEMFNFLKIIHKEVADEPISMEKLLNKFNYPENDILEALYYFYDTQNIHSGLGDGFPYKENSFIQLNEKIPHIDNILEILTQFYKSNYLKKEEVVKLQISPIKDKKRGKPSYENEIKQSYQILKNQNKIDFSRSLESYTREINEAVQIMLKSDKYPNISYKTIWKHVGIDFDKNKKSI